MGENGIDGEGQVMETPNRSKSNQMAATPVVTKIEDSPVFNFLNNLSPIKLVKSAHVSQTIDPLYFGSIPSVFTSPHANPQMASKILRRHQVVPDPSKPEFAPHCDHTVQESCANSDAGAKELEGQVEVLKARDSDSELAAEAPFDCLQFVVDPTENLSFSGGSSKEPCQRVLYGNEVNTEGKNMADDYTEAASSEWDRLISDAMNFESPNDKDSYKISDDPSPSFFKTIENEIHGICSAVSNEQSREAKEHEGREIDEPHEIITTSSASDPGEEPDCEHPFGFYRGIRRRCLVFETGGVSRKHLEGNFITASSLTGPPERNDYSEDLSLVPMKAENSSSHRVLPGIGLHLNALPTAPTDHRIISHDSSASRQLLIGPSSSVDFHLSTSNREDPCQESAYIATEDMSQSSSKRKRRKAEPSGDDEGCKQCNCKKSKCLKLYCECFAAGVYCMDNCACFDCFNKPVHEDTVLATRKQIESRNPIAFAPKVIRGSDPSETGDYSSKTPASARHKRGCNCKKSGCLKKYCECYQGGVGCSVNCRCEGCKNTFGRKDGMEPDVEDVETETSMFDETSHEENNLVSAVPSTIQRARRQLIQHKKKPPNPSGPISSINIRNALRNRTIDQLGTVKEDELSPPCCVVKSSSSPNGKRVSPPHGTTTGLRSSRKLILQSIPSFPSLTQNQ